MARTRRSTDLGEPGFIQVHARMPEHPKVVGLGDRAFRLLVESWCWSWRNRTDGRIPAGMWARSGTPAARRELVAARLVDPAEGGVLLHDWSDWQETVADRERLREARAEAGSKGGRARAKRQASATASATASAKPVPKQTASKIQAEYREEREAPNGASPSETSSPRGPRKRATPAPDHLLVTAEMRQWATDQQIHADLDRETAAFLDFHRSKGSTFQDWTAAWRTWMRNTRKYGAHTPPPAETGGRRWE